MLLQQLTVENVRIIRQALISPGPSANVFVGANAQGKTSLLEAVAILADGHSFRTRRLPDILSWDVGAGRVLGEVARADGQVSQLDVRMTSEGRRYRINRLDVGLDEYVGRIAFVVFTVEHMSIADGPPHGRRQFLDRALFGLYPAYLRTARTYQRILNQRNQLLKRGGSGSELDAWTEQLVAAAGAVTRRRLQYLRLLEPAAAAAHLQLGNGEILGLAYRHSWGELNSSDIEPEGRLRQAFAAAAGRERQRRITLVGPHRDDLMITINNRPLRPFASRGQQRSAVLSLKLAEVSVFRQVAGETPIVLLDDLTSELDSARCGLLFSLLDNEIQSFITTTDYDKVTRLSAGFRRYELSRGSVEVKA